MTFLPLIPSVAVLVVVAGAAVAQTSTTPAAQNWNSGYGVPSPTERNVRLNFIIEQEKLRSGFYQPQSTTTNTYISNDHSVANNVNAAEGAVVDIESRTAEGSGTSSYVVGAINTSTNTITTDGAGHTVTIVNEATSDAGCIDGGIATANNRPVGGVDISAGGAASTGAAALIENVRGNC